MHLSPPRNFTVKDICWLCSAVLAHFMLNEKLNTFGVLGCVLCISGSITIVLHAPEEREISSLLQVWRMAMNPGKCLSSPHTGHSFTLYTREIFSSNAASGKTDYIGCKIQAILCKALGFMWGVPAHVAPCSLLLKGAPCQGNLKTPSVGSLQSCLLSGTSYFEGWGCPWLLLLASNLAHIKPLWVW